MSLRRTRRVVHACTYRVSSRLAGGRSTGHLPFLARPPAPLSRPNIATQILTSVAPVRIHQENRNPGRFILGLFDHPHVDPVAAERVAGGEAFRAAGADAQRRSIVLLKNAEPPSGKLLPLRGRPKLYVEHVAPDVPARCGDLVSTPGVADVAIVRVGSPYEPRDGFLERFFHAGDLSFPDAEKARLLALAEQAPTIVAIHLDRPAVNPEIAARSAGLLPELGASDEALLDVIVGRVSPSGKVPFELPSSMDAVRRQKEDVPYDSERPLYLFGHGLPY